jgi:UDP-2,3-diacylglucosamine pyrophosphatase LpxH
MATSKTATPVKTKKPKAAEALPTSHDSLLQRLLDAFPNGVYLVARCADKDLGLLDDTTLRVFFPDFHWMSRECLARYSGGYHFNGNDPSSRPLMATLLSLLRDAQSQGGAIEVYHLGDRFDLWREVTRADASILAAFERVSGDPLVSGLSERLDQLGTRYIRGNHDAWIREVENSRPTLKKSQDQIVTGSGKIRLLHGHQFDIVESLLPNSLKADFVGLAPKIKPGTYAIGPFPNSTVQEIQNYLDYRNRAHRPDLHPAFAPGGARLLTAIGGIEAIETDSKAYLDVSVFSHGSGGANDVSNDFRYIGYLEFGDETLTFEQNDPANHSVHVIGHTHHARILVDRIPGTNFPHVTLDCGGWIEKCTVRSGPNGHASVAPSAQFAVQFGNDIRIYQLTASSPAPAS